MPEEFRALVVVLALGAATFALLRRTLCPVLLGYAEFDRRRNAWFAITVVLFLSHNFWLFVAFAALVLLAVGRAEQHLVSLVAFLLFAAPTISARIPGLGIVESLIDLNYLRLLALLLAVAPLLGPASALRPGWMRETPHRLLLGYVLVNVALAFGERSLTGALRCALLICLDSLPIVLVASGTTRTLELQRSAAASFVAGACVLALTGCFEAWKGWLLYQPLPRIFDLPFAGEYLRRDGALRASATAGQAIPFGYALAVASCLWLGLRQLVASRGAWYAVLALLIAGMIASFSRGPWIGAFLGLLVFSLTGTHRVRTLVRIGAAGGVVAFAAAATPLADRVLYPLTVDVASYDYRERVLQATLGQVLEHPLFGPPDFLAAEEIQALKQGQGIIDIVNTYAGIALESGFVGLALFVGFFAACAAALLRGMRAYPADSGERALGRGLLAALACIALTVSSVSRISMVPMVYWLVGGLAIAYGRIAAGAPPLARTGR
jgi:O-antigen ligase